MSEIRAINRAIAALRVINRDGGATLTHLSRELSLPQATVLRIVQTLEVEGLVGRQWKTWAPTAGVRTLSCGYRFNDALISAARPVLVDLTRRTAWAVTISGRAANQFVVRDTTCELAESVFRTYPGFILSVVGSASGQAYLSHCDEGERRSMLASAGEPRSEAGGDEALTWISDVRRDGFAVRRQQRRLPALPVSSTLALPILAGEAAIGSIAITYEADALEDSQAVEAYLPMLKAAAQTIGGAVA